MSVQSTEMNGGTIRQREAHRSGRSGWLRAAVLGSNDAIVSTASLMVGVAAASASRQAILIAGVAGLVAGSMSMAVGEYVSVSAQRDSEQADIELERQELAVDPRAELNELAMIYVKRGLEKELYRQAASNCHAQVARPAAIRPPFTFSLCGQYRLALVCQYRVMIAFRLL
jgi:VIT1/CCC1 family predicted Fe2+/Mn2+ transporter